MTSYSVSQKEIVTEMFYFFLQYTDTALGKITSKLTYELKSLSTPSIHDQGACRLLAACFVAFLSRNEYYNGLKRARGGSGTE